MNKSDITMSTGWQSLRRGFHRIKRLLHNRVTRRGAYILFSVLVVLVLVRALLPVGVQWYVNRQLDSSAYYTSSIGDVDIALIKSAYSVEKVTISKLVGETPVPLFSADRVDFSLRWSRLLHGEVVAQIAFYRPNINLVDSEQDDRIQTGENENWVSMVNNLVPIQIDLVTVADGELHFRNFDPDIPVDVFVTQLNGSVENLSNRPQQSTGLPSSIRGSGQIMQSGNVQLQGQFDIGLENPTFNLDARVRNVPIIELDAMIKTYAPFDVEGGNLTITAELAASDGEITGYFKPLIVDMEVFDWKEDVLNDNDNPFKVLWETLVDLTSELLENQPRNRLATVIPISGRLDNPDTDAWAAFLSILRNAFVEALDANFENTVSADSLEVETNDGKKTATEEDEEK